MSKRKRLSWILVIFIFQSSISTGHRGPKINSVFNLVIPIITKTKMKEPAAILQPAVVI